jgi:hypothetical protein
MSLLDELEDLFSEFPVVADAEHGGMQASPICLGCLWLLVLYVLTQYRCEGLLW